MPVACLLALSFEDRVNLSECKDRKGVAQVTHVHAVCHSLFDTAQEYVGSYIDAGSFSVRATSVKT